MSSNVNIKINIRVPPEGTLIKELVMTGINALSYVAYKFKLGSVKAYEDKIVIETSDPFSLYRSVENQILKLIEIKNRLNVRWPPLHINDKGTLKKSKIVGEAVKNLSNYGDLVSYYMKNLANLLTKTVELDLKIKDQLVLGRGVMAMLQLFKIELYENALSLNQAYTKDYEIRLDDEWLSLILLGYAYSHISFGGGYLELITLPKLSDDPNVFSSYMLIEIANIAKKIRTQPTLPFIMLTHIISSMLQLGVYKKFLDLDPNEIALLEEILSPADISATLKTFPEMRIHRINFYGKTYTEISREEVVYNRELLHFLNKLNVRCIEQLFDLATRAVEARDPKVLNVITLLYESINNAKDRSYTLYYMARTLAESDRKFLDRDCMREIIEKL